MTDPVERVARAIAEVAGMSLDSLDMKVVRAAIAAVPGEPVAYRWRWADAPTDAWNASTVNPDQLGKIVEPLYAAPAMPATDAVREAARAVIDRWETPAWKDAPATAVYINALRAALSHPSQGGWQPIATAPKDGTRILVVCDGDTRVAAWGKTSHVPMYGFCLADQGAEDFDLVQVDLWQPLPAPPEVQL